jgi:hypothetical protein
MPDDRGVRKPIVDLHGGHNGYELGLLSVVNRDGARFVKWESVWVWAL